MTISLSLKEKTLLNIVNTYKSYGLLITFQVAKLHFFLDH